MFITAHIAPILFVTGVITALPVVQFFFPAAMKVLSKLELTDEGALFFARHWGLVTLTIGALLCYAGAHEEARRPIVLAIVIEKAGLVGLLASQWNRPYARGLRGAALFDGLCCLVYAAFLLKIA